MVEHHRHRVNQLRVIRCSVVAAGMVLGAGCVDQPVFPRVGVPTLDDSGTDTYVAVSAGLEHTCALITGGAAYCWGSNEFGQLGAAADTTCARDDRRIPCRLRPAAVSGGLSFMQISAGARHTCALSTSNRIHCWGDNLRGQLGEPAVRSSTEPIPIPSTALFVAVAAGGFHTCGLRTDGIAFCWGANETGQLGNASTGLGSAAPDSVRTNTRYASIVAGPVRTCGRTSGGATFCWGSFWVANLAGADVTRSQPSPQRILSAPDFKSLSIGANTMCGIAVQGSDADENSLHCWEANPAGGIGNGTLLGSTVPRLVGGGAVRFIAVSAGSLQTCGIADTGFAYCWGDDSFGQLGVPSSLVSSRCGATRAPCSLTPVRVSGWRLFTEITAGQGHHGCGRSLAGNIYCWGAGNMGQRGDGRAFFGDWSLTKTAWRTS